MKKQNGVYDDKIYKQSDLGGSSPKETLGLLYNKSQVKHRVRVTVLKLLHAFAEIKLQYNNLNYFVKYLLINTKSPELNVSFNYRY